MKVRYTVIVGAGLVFFLGSLLIGTYFVSQGGCSLGTFTCSKGDICVPQRAMCNGRADCPDGEDESALSCGDFHGSRYLMSLMLGAKFNKSIHDCEQEDVPLGCFCRNQDWVYCKDLNLTAVPARIQGNVSRLILANNSIAELAEDAFYSYQLELIHLEGNGIISLPSHVFRGQTRLTKLLLLGNKLEEIRRELFRGLTNLTLIYLQNNRIRFLDGDVFSDLESLRYLDLSGNQIVLDEDGFPSVPNLTELFLDNNLIATLKEHDFDNVTNLAYLGLSANGIKSIHPNVFQNVKNLSELDLSHNRLKVLAPEVFSPLTKLRKLFLGYNPLESIAAELFHELSSVASLDMEEIEIENISTEMFRGMVHLDFIYFKKYYYCTFAPNVPKCAPKSDGLSSFEDLLGRPILRVILWVVATSTCLGNVYVFWGRLATRDENRSLSWIVRNLADFLMGIYLTTIGVKDWEYRGIYHEVSHEWMRSWLCSFAGALAMLSSEVSIFILVFMSIERFLLIAVPFSGHKTLTPRAAVRCLVIIWAIGFATAVCPMVLYRTSTRFYGANGMCFPLHLDDPYFAGWQFSSFIFLFVNLTGLVVLAVLYSGMFVSVWRTRHATCTISSGDFEFAIRFFFIVLTNTACWLPIVILKILAFYRIYISAAAYAWVAVMVVPVNSAFNPLLYTLTTPKYRELIRKAALRRTRALPPSRPLTSVDTTCSNASNPRGRLNTMDTANAASCDEPTIRGVRPTSLSHSSFDEGSVANFKSLVYFEKGSVAESRHESILEPEYRNLSEKGKECSAAVIAPETLTSNVNFVGTTDVSYYDDVYM